MVEINEAIERANTAENRARLATGSVLAGRYCIQGVIGEGAMGTVYSAEHLALKKRVAVKVLHLDLLRLPNIAARFEREAHAMARVEHPNVTMALDFGRLENGALYLVLEFVEGRSLREELARGRLSLQRALFIARQIAQVLATTQPLNIVHRDLKPENIILTQRGAEADFVKVLDFGIARIAGCESDSEAQAPLTKLGAVFGTPEYMAPEQAMGQHVDTRADIYSLGVILFEMLTGVRPYVQTGQSGILSLQLTSPRPTLAERAPDLDVPDEVERLVARMLAKGAQERFQRGSDVVSAIESLVVPHGPETVKSGAVPGVTDGPLPSFPLTTKLPGLEGERLPLVSHRENTPWEVRVKHWREECVEKCHEAAVAVAAYADKLVEELRQRLPEKQRQRLLQVPRNAVCTALALVAILLAVFPVAVVALAIRCSRAPEVASPAESAAPVLASAAPSSSGSSRPVSLVLDENSKDPDVLIELGIQRLQADKESEALGLILRALVVQPERRNDPRVARVLYRTVNSSSKETVDKSFALLQGVMAAKGAEILYLLWLDRAVSDTIRKRIDRWIRSEAFDRAAAGSISIAAKLRMADHCERKASLLPTAGKIGGAAVLTYLEELEQTTGCGLNGAEDCFPCMRHDQRLKEAISLVRSRGDAKPK